MSESNEKLLESIRRHARVQTVLQAGALIELEAHRQHLAAQSKMMEESALLARRHENDKSDLSYWRQCIADVEIAAESGNVRVTLVALLAKEYFLTKMPTGASLEEVARTKKLLQNKNALFEAVRADQPDWFARMEDWWRDHDVDNRIKALRTRSYPPEIKGVGDEAREGAVDLKEVRAFLSGATAAYSLAEAELKNIEVEIDSLARDERLVLLAIHAETASELREERWEMHELKKSLDSCITLPDICEANKRSESFGNGVVAILVVLFLALVLWGSTFP